MGCLLVANGLHTYGVFVQRSSIISSTRVIPYYFPLEATRTLEKWGLKHSPNVLNANVGKGNVNFPLHPLKVANAKRPNIIFILIDSWNMHTLTKETMPVAWQFAMDNQWYHNHFSSSNGTRYSIFGMFFSVPSIYWNSMESGHVSPSFINTLLNEGYNIHAFIAPGDVILKKEGDGSLTITDKHLRPLPGYHVNVKQFNQAMDCLNRYFKK